MSIGGPLVNGGTTCTRRQTIEPYLLTSRRHRRGPTSLLAAASRPVSPNRRDRRRQRNRMRPADVGRRLPAASFVTAFDSRHFPRGAADFAVRICPAATAAAAESDGETGSGGHGSSGRRGGGPALGVGPVTRRRGCRRSVAVDRGGGGANVGTCNAPVSATGVAAVLVKTAADAAAASAATAAGDREGRCLTRGMGPLLFLHHHGGVAC